ncbi:MAG: hypothetical protein HKN26_00395 [Acidimicrobiales bacterium]|nr:hypothetical protein [Acidimicrobiales bacterium]
MDLWVTLGVLVRRWYLTLPLVAAVAFSAYSVSSSLKPTYEAQASLRILCPDQFFDQNTGELRDANPLDCNARSVIDIAGDMIDIIQSPTARNTFNEQGLANDYAVDGTDPPRITIIAENDDAQVALDTARTAVSYIEQQVEAYQPERPDVYTTRALSVPQEATEISSGRTRMMITIVVAGMIFAVMLVHLIDALMVFWKRRKDDPPAAGVPAASPPADRVEPPAAVTSERRPPSVPEPQAPASAAADEPDLRAVAGDTGPRGRWGR